MRRNRQGRALGFAYRTSPEHLVPQNFFHVVTPSDPPMDVIGMATVHLDLHGRLRSLARIPILANATNDEPPWPRHFAEAGLAIDDFDVTTGGRRPLVAHDTVSGGGRASNRQFIHLWQNRDGADPALREAPTGNRPSVLRQGAHPT